MSKISLWWYQISLGAVILPKCTLGCTPAHPNRGSEPGCWLDYWPLGGKSKTSIHKMLTIFSIRGLNPASKVKNLTNEVKNVSNEVKNIGAIQKVRYSPRGVGGVGKKDDKVWHGDGVTGQGWINCYKNSTVYIEIDLNQEVWIPNEILIKSILM